MGAPFLERANVDADGVFCAWCREPDPTLWVLDTVDAVATPYHARCLAERYGPPGPDHGVVVEGGEL